MDPQNPNSPVKGNGQERNKKILWILILIVVIAGLAGGAYYLLQTPEGMSNATPPPQLDSIPTSTPTQTEEPVSISKEEVAIEVLNGTGIAGEAGFLQDELEELGYSDIEVGNADDQDNETTQVLVTEEFSNSTERQELEEALDELYETVEFSVETPDDFDVRIITGLREGQTPRPNATTAPTDDDEEEEEEDEVSPTPTST